MRFPGRWVSALAAAAVVLAAPFGAAKAQDTGTLTGTVVDAETEQMLESAQVFIAALNLGTLTDADGRFTLPGVPAGTHEVGIEILGYGDAAETVTVSTGETATVEFRLTSTALQLQELVVTGVADATPKSKLAITVETMDFTDTPVTAPSAEGLMQSKVPGVKIQRTSGKPGDEAEIMLRGPTSIRRGNTPLIIIDGVVTDVTLADVEALDIASIEIVKGAAAASLYGSRAQAGVVQIQTKRGSNLDVDESRITIRNEYGISQIEGSIGLSNSHPFKLNDAGEFIDDDGEVIDFGNPNTGSPALDDGGTPSTAFQDNPYPGTLYDHLERFYRPGDSFTNYVAVAGRTGSTNYRASFSNTKEEGIVENNDGFDRRTVRLNLDHQVRDNLNFSASAYYAKSHQDELPNGQNGTPDAFFDLTFMAPNVDLAARNPNDMDCRLAERLGGCLFINPDPRANQNNPLYAIENLELDDDRQRFSAAANARWSPLTWFDLEGNFSLDRYDFHRTNVEPLGFADAQDTPDDPIERSLGSLRRENIIENDINASVTAAFNFALGDLTTRTRLRYLIEDDHTEAYEVIGNEFTVKDVPVLDNVNEEATDVESSIEDIIAQGYYFISALDYQGKYLGDFMVRRDGSSLFGPDQRWQTYFRASGGWRISQEAWWPFEAIDEFKLRYSIGTAGGRPDFEDQYETYSVGGGVIQPVTLGNKELKPELTTEQEFGLDMVLFGRVSAGVNYVTTKVEDQLHEVPLPGYRGFSNQWRNAGTLEGHTFEAFLEAAIIDRPDIGWTMRANFDRTRSEITRLDVPAFSSGRIWIKEGEPFGVFYGDRWATGCGGLADGVSCSEFAVNDDGYIVWVGEGNSYTDGIAQGLWGTDGPVNPDTGSPFEWGMPIKEYDENGSTFLRMGNATPEFNLSWMNTFRFRNFTIHALFDGEFGADIYNQTAQWAQREWRHGEADQAGKADGLKKPVGYYSALYNVNDDNSHYVEDGTYVKFRELGVRYQFDPSLLDRIGLGMTGASLQVTGRNLKTWTDFTGYDPEVGNVIRRDDNYDYPNFRTIRAVVELVF